MRDNTGRVVVALLLMVGLWVCVYWLWPVEPPISLAPVSTAAGPAEPVNQIVRRIESPSGAAKAGPSPQTVRGVVAPAFMQHVVREGDTLETISQARLGTPDHAGAIAASNPFLSPSELRAGRVIRVPLDPANVQGLPAQRSMIAADAAPPAASVHSAVTDPVTKDQKWSEWTVQKGDTLSGISQQVYGTVRFSGAIFEANKDQLKAVNKLKPGQKLRIPPLGKAAGG